MIEMHELINEYYMYALMKSVEGEEALNYLVNRGFTEELIKSRGIGMPLITLTFVMTFTTKGYDIELAMKLVCYHVTKKILVTTSF